MFDHVTMRVADLAASHRFYERLFPDEEAYVSDLGSEWGDFSIAPAGPDRPPTRHVGIVLGAPSVPCPDAVDPDGNRVEVVPRAGGVTIEHLRLRSRDVDAAKRFYEVIAPVVGHPAISFPADGPRTENLHLAFGVPSNAQVDEFHRVALAAGYRDYGAPGERRVYHPGYYGAFVLDPDGNNVEAVCHNRD